MHIVGMVTFAWNFDSPQELPIGGTICEEGGHWQPRKEQLEA